MKKLVSRFMAVLMAMTMILSMSMTAFADESVVATPTGTLTVNNTVKGKTLDLYQIFTATKNGDFQNKSREWFSFIWRSFK